MTRYKIITKEPNSDQNMTIYLESENKEVARKKIEAKDLIVVKIFEPKSVKPQKIKKLRESPPSHSEHQILKDIFPIKPIIATQSDNSEQDIWEQSPAQVTGIVKYGFLTILSTVVLVVGILFEPLVLYLTPLCVLGFLLQFIAISSTHFKLTTERIIITTGLFSRNFEELELFRVKDYQLVQPFALRFFGLSNIVLLSSDMSTPSIILFAIKDGTVVRDKIRKGVLDNREKMQVREIDI